MAENKQVRVDNWGIFFLQRLQLFFSKTYYCDLTLQFQGNVQLKVHRLVLNACTEYFELLEHSDRMIDDNVLLMPDMLQADVAVPIINFMYTGMLEYPISIYNKLYQAADLMRMSVLTKLLDAQRDTVKTEKPKIKSARQTFMPTKVSSPISSPVAPPSRKTIKTNIPELPPALPGRKLPVWKRKSVGHSSSVASFSRSETRHRSDLPPLAAAAKPTRFEWPEDDLELPPLDMMDVSDFGDISYTSKPLLIEDEVKPIIHSQSGGNKIEKEEIEMNLDEKSDQNSSSGEKRKIQAESIVDRSPKRIKIVENEKDTTISVISSGPANFDPTKIVSEILKKYPHLVKKKKNIKLKIMSKPKEKESEGIETQEKVSVKKVENVPQISKHETSSSAKDNNTWYCKECSENTGKPMEFMLYYLYRKHMTDIHNMKFDPRICKYCGIPLANTDLHSFHLFTKHGIKPSGGQVFPSCSQCPYVALSKKTLQIHKSKHKNAERQCTVCKLAFVSMEAITSHVQITDHMGKTRKNAYDCQYCTKVSQSAISLLSHIKSSHEAEGRRDGIVSLDEIDLEENFDLEQEETTDVAETEEEYVVPGVKCHPVNKVKIISDVKVAATKNVNRTEIVTLDQSKVTTNVPGTIATSLGLLDIVVLDDSQQFILQNQGEQGGETRTEYILPQITQRNVRGDDELVMMLTDQDYKDGHSSITTDNSNIVVLYSHPADGQQEQFITSEGNLMVNSETGLLEIRNGATIATTSANQIVLRDTHSADVETIEMIQREIDGSQTLKQETSYYEEQKPQVTNEIEHVEYSTEEGGCKEEKSGEITLDAEEQLEKSDDSENQTNGAYTTEEMDISTSDSGIINQTAEVPLQTPNSTDLNESVEESEVPQEVEDKDCSKEEQSTTEEEIEKSENHQEESIEEQRVETAIEVQETVETEQAKNVENVEPSNEEADQSNETIIDDSQKTIIVEEPPMEVEEHQEKATEENNESETNEDKTVTEVADIECKEKVPAPTETSQSSFESRDEEKPYSPTDNPIDMQCEIESTTDTNDKQDNDSVNDQVIQQTEEKNEIKETKLIESDSFSEDEYSFSAGQQDTTKCPSENVTENVTESTISILDDWEDTDSQQSDIKSKTTKKGAQETVHKLMDDWEEDEVEK